MASIELEKFYKKNVLIPIGDSFTFVICKVMQDMFVQCICLKYSAVAY